MQGDQTLLIPAVCFHCCGLISVCLKGTYLFFLLFVILVVSNTSVHILGYEEFFKVGLLGWNVKSICVFAG